MPVGTEVGLGPGDIALNGDPASPSPKKGTEPQFSANVCCGQTAGWIKIPLSMEVGLGPGHIAWMGTQIPLERGIQPPHFSAHVYCGQTAGWIKMPLGTKVGRGLGNIVLDAIDLPFGL